MHMALDDCWDFNKRFPHRQNNTNRPPISSTMSVPRSDRRDEDSEEGSRFSGYDRPRYTRGRYTAGNGGDGGRIPPTGGDGRRIPPTGGDGRRIPPTGGNVAGGGDPGDSDPSSNCDNSDSRPFDPRNILGSRKDHWDEPRKAKYDKRLRRLLKLRNRQRNSKGSAHKPKKPVRLGLDPFDGDPKDTQRVIQDVEIKLNYFRESL